MSQRCAKLRTQTELNLCHTRPNLTVKKKQGGGGQAELNNGRMAELNLCQARLTNAKLRILTEPNLCHTRPYLTVENKLGRRGQAELNNGQMAGLNTVTGTRAELTRLGTSELNLMVPRMVLGRH